ncbi:MAG: RNA-binding S4 domain-containing protein [Gemmatimonadota bacterium]|nr:MAG: RNA-binding S4 domain-containing protein [Gemmatimonadota bacterium]
MRVDQFLKTSCLVKHRTEAKKACDLGVVTVNGRPVKASKDVRPGDIISVNSDSRFLEMEILDIPPKQVSKKEAKKLYRIIHDEHKKLLDF